MRFSVLVNITNNQRGDCEISKNRVGFFDAKNHSLSVTRMNWKSVSVSSWDRGIIGT